MNENSPISVVNVSDVPRLKRQVIINGGMIPKVDCCVEAVRRGGRRGLSIIDWRIEHWILIEMSTDQSTAPYS